MSLLEIKGRIALDDPVLLLAISGWVDSGSVATKVGEHLSGYGEVAAAFKADDVYDYQTSRPSLELSDGATSQIRFPDLSIYAVSLDDVDLLVVTGTEPSSRWQAMAAELAGLADTVGVTRVVAVGAVAAMVAHTRPTPVIVTSNDPDLEPSGIPAGRLVVPAALVNVLSNHVAKSNGVPEVGFWAQVPHYVSGTYWPGVEALLTRMSPFLGTRTDLSEIRTNAQDLVSRLDQAVSGRPEAERFIREMEEATPGFALEEDSGLTEEIEDFLRSLDDDDNPFS